MRILRAMIATINQIIIAFDRFLLVKLNALTGVFPLFDEVFVILAEGVVFMLVGAYVMYLFKSSKSSNRLLLLGEAFVSTIIARFIFVTGLRLIHFRFRPFLCESITQLVAHNPLEASFPSGHAAVMAALAMSMWYLNKKIGLLFGFFAVMSAFARVVVGVHYPLDVVVGLACGVVSAVLARKLYTYAVHESPLSVSKKTVASRSTKSVKKSKK